MIFRNEKWKDGWLWIQTTPDGKWDTALATEIIASLAERVAKLERPAEAVEPTAFEPEDFAFAAKMLRKNVGLAPVYSNIILAALDTMSKDMTP